MDESGHPLHRKGTEPRSRLRLGRPTDPEAHRYGQTDHLSQSYEETAPKDARRVLVDRAWPRGMRKKDTHLDEWLRGVAPSSEPRERYAHEPSRFHQVPPPLPG
ncbi:DUF488 domain-containing protein [Streptomyces sp. NPDC056637]|uniref:DUF488 domain-containing protein n=1 Tax=unclassified Streptomyces TaxID=2593676 RepID=UPI00365CC317